MKTFLPHLVCVLQGQKTYLESLFVREEMGKDTNADNLDF